MTGLDCLREEMKNRGMRQSQIESQVVPVILDIIAESENKYAEMWREEVAETTKLKELRSEIRSAEHRLDYLNRLVGKMEQEEEEAEKHREHCEDYIDEFHKALEACETADGRDIMRVAQMYVNSVSVDTKYDNTAYIIGLAAILSGGKINAIEELQKINKKLPAFDGYVEITRKRRKG